METSQKLTLVDGMEQWTLFQEGSLVSPSVKPGFGKAQRMNATCGQKCLEQFARFPRVGLWAKTFAGLLIGMKGWYSTKCKLTWKLKGTKSNRFYFQLVPSTLPTEGTEYGSADGEILPTPTATSDPKGGCTRPNPKRQRDTLAHAIHGEIGVPGKTSQLNPRFVAEMMGFPVTWTELPFQSGETKV